MRCFRRYLCTLLALYRNIGRYYFLVMADNYLEKKFEEFHSGKGGSRSKSTAANNPSLNSLLLKNRSYRGFDSSRQVSIEELELYQQLAQDTTNLYNRGMTTETEFNQAITNRDKAQIQCQIAELELLLHYIATRQLFVQEVQ